MHPRVVRKIARNRKVWVADDGSILKTLYEQTLPEAFTVEMIFGEGVLAVHKTTDGKRQSAEVQITIDPLQFENEFLTMVWSKRVFKESKSFAMLDPFGGTIRTMQAKIYAPFEGLEGPDRVSGYRVDITEGKGTSTAWVTHDGRLLQYDLAGGDRLIVEPKVGEAGITKVKLGRPGGT